MESGVAADSALLRLLQAMPALSRRCFMSFLDEKLSAATWVVVCSHFTITVSTGLYVLVRSEGDRLLNDIGALIASMTTVSYLVATVLKRRTLRRLHAELIEYCRDLETDATPLVRAKLAPIPGRLRLLWTMVTGLTMCCWAFYTVTPFIFEWVHDVPIGSMRRLSAMVYPLPCDLRGDLCYRAAYVAVAGEWFFAGLAFCTIESTNLGFYTVATKLFEALGASFGQVQAGPGGEDDALVLTGGGHVPACKRTSMTAPGEMELRRCVRRHQVLLRWSKEMTEVYSLPTFMRLGNMTLLLAIAIIKPLLTDNYVMDELPYFGFYGAETIFVICWFADELSRASAEVHGQAYLCRFERGGPAFQRSLDIVLTRTLRPVTARAYWVRNLALRTFVDVINRAYSALQAIRAVRKKTSVQSVDLGVDY